MWDMKKALNLSNEAIDMNFTDVSKNICDVITSQMLEINMTT